MLIILNNNAEHKAMNCMYFELCISIFALYILYILHNFLTLLSQYSAQMPNFYIEIEVFELFIV